jgi:hypothetical protein
MHTPPRTAPRSRPSATRQSWTASPSSANRSPGRHGVTMACLSGLREAVSDSETTLAAGPAQSAGKLRLSVLSRMPQTGIQAFSPRRRIGCHLGVLFARKDTQSLITPEWLELRFRHIGQSWRHERLRAIGHRKACRHELTTGFGARARCDRWDKKRLLGRERIRQAERQRSRTPHSGSRKAEAEKPSGLCVGIAGLSVATRRSGQRTTFPSFQVE